MALRYPYKKIESSDDYLKIDIIKYVPPGLETQGGGGVSFALQTSDQTYSSGEKINILETIILPIPETIGDTNSAQWGASQLGPIEANIASGASRAMNATSANEILGNLMGAGEKIGAAAKTGIVQQGFKAGFAAAAIRAALGGGGNRYLERGAGITFNQNIELIFNGVNLRDAFSFGFNIVPRSEIESQTVKQIIRSFKKYSAVGKGADKGGAAGLFLKAPQVFRLRYMSGSNPHPFLNKFKVCALTNMSVNYTGSGTYATYADATPVHIVLTLTFQELTPIYYEDYLTADEGEGNPTGSDDGIGVGY